MSSAFMYIIFFQCKSYSGHVKAMHNHMSHIQVMQTWVSTVSFISPPLARKCPPLGASPGLISNSGHCAQGVFEPKWALGLFRHAEELQAALETCQHHSSQQSLHYAGSHSLMLFCTTQHNTIVSFILFSSLLY